MNSNFTYSSGNKTSNYLNNYGAYFSCNTQMKQTYTYNLPYPLQKPADLNPNPPVPVTTIVGNKTITQMIQY